MKIVYLPLFLGLSLVFSSCESDRDRACVELQQHQLKEDSWAEPGIKYEAFYSRSLETCISVARDLKRISIEVDDASDDFLRGAQLFHCDRDGVDAAVLDSVRAHGGYMSEINYGTWLDDGVGGPPRTLRTPTTPFTQARCDAAWQKYQAQIK